MLLVLDLDETLVRVRCEGVHPTRKTFEADFTVAIDVATPPKSSVYECAIVKRPGLDDFLSWCQDQRDKGRIEGPWIYTTSSGKYTKAVLKHLDPGGKIFGLRVLTREACLSASMPGFLLKDLNRVPSGQCEDARRRVLVDNNPVSHVLYPDNAVLVRDWLGDNPADVELDRVRDLLEQAISGEHPEVEAHMDFATRITKVTPGHVDFRQKLEVLERRLAGAPPTEVPALRAELRAVVEECHAIKQELLGAAP